MLKKTLASLPPSKSLDTTYDRILQNIDGMYCQAALQILRWLAYSPRPLTLEETAEVAAIDVDSDPQFDETNRLPDPFDILDDLLQSDNCNDRGEDRRPFR